MGDTQQVELVAYIPALGDVTVTNKSIHNLDAETLPDEGAGWVTICPYTAATRANLLVEMAKWLPAKVADDGHLYIAVLLSSGLNPSHSQVRGHETNIRGHQPNLRAIDASASSPR